MERLFNVLDWQGRHVKGSDRKTKKEAKDIRDTLNSKVKKSGQEFTVGISMDHWRNYND